MSEAGKTQKPEAADRRRLNYLKVRLKALREELQAARKETAELREKLGLGAKTAGGAQAGAGKKQNAADSDDD